MGESFSGTKVEEINLALCMLQMMLELAKTIVSWM